MNYRLEEMSADDKEAVCEVASAQQKRRLLGRKYFEDEPDLHWTIDRQSGSFLMNAPPLGATFPGVTLLFFFEGHLFDIALDGYGLKPVRVEPRERISDWGRFKASLIEAFQVHGMYGSTGKKTSFDPTFEDA